MRCSLIVLFAIAQACSDEAAVPDTAQADVAEIAAPETSEDTVAPSETIEDTVAPPEAIEDTVAPSEVIEETVAPPETIEDTVAPPETIEDTVAAETIEDTVIAVDTTPADTVPAETLVPDPTSCGAGLTRRAQSLSGGGSVTTRALAVHPDGAVSVFATLGGRHTFGADTAAEIGFHAGLNSPALLHYGVDGTIKWVKHFSGGGGYAHAIGRASDGSLVVAGSFQAQLVIDSGLPTEQRLTGPGSEEGYDVFVARVSALGQLLWVRVAGGLAFDFPQAAAVAPDGSSFVAGYFADAWDDHITFDAQHALTAPSDGWETLFIAAYDPNGAVRWVRQAGSPSRDDIVSGMTRLPDGSIVIAGSVGDRGAQFEGGAQSDRTLTYGDSGFYLARYTADGDLLWLEGASGPDGASSSGGGVASTGTTIAMLINGDAGITLDQGQASARTFASAASAVALFDDAGVLLSLTPVKDRVSFGGPAGIAIAPDGTIAIAGSYYAQATFMLTSGPLQLTSAGWTDAFVACLPAGGSALAWVRQGRGVLQDLNAPVAFSPDGSILSGGDTRDGLDFEVGDSTTLPVGGDDNGYLVEIAR